jgi:hypothetical protein
MMEHMLDPGIVGIAVGWNTILPARIVAEALAAPLRNIEWRIGEDEICTKVWV